MTFTIIVLGFLIGVVAFLGFVGWRVRKNTESGYYDSDRWLKHHPDPHDDLENMRQGYHYEEGK